MAIPKKDSLANNNQAFTETNRPLASRSGIKVITNKNLRSLHTKFRANRTNGSIDGCYLVSEAAGSLAGVTAMRA